MRVVKWNIVSMSNSAEGVDVMVNRILLVYMRLGGEEVVQCRSSYSRIDEP